MTPTAMPKLTMKLAELPEWIERTIQTLDDPVFSGFYTPADIANGLRNMLKVLRETPQDEAASAQVREVEPWGYEFDDAAGVHHVVKGPLPSYAQSNIKPAAEPAPVAYADHTTKTLHIAPTPPRREPAPVAQLLAADDPIEQMRKVSMQARELNSLISRQWVNGWADQWETERAGYARRESELEVSVFHLRDDLSEMASRATEAEASLAACRADAERYRWLRDPMQPLRDALCADDLCSNDLDAAIDALRQEAPHAE